MGLTVSNTGGGSTQQPTAGLTPAVCTGIVDLGHQEDHFKPGFYKEKVALLFELTEQTYEDKEGVSHPMTRTKTYTQSLYDGSGEGSEAALHKDLCSWRGRRFTETELGEFKLGNVLGVPCTLNLTINKNDKVVIGGVMAAQKQGITAKAVPFAYDFNEPGTNWEKVPSFLQGDIKKSQEWPKLASFIPMTAEEDQAETAPNRVANEAPTEEDEPPF